MGIGNNKQGRTPSSHTTTMSNNNAPPSIAALKNILATVSLHISQAYESQLDRKALNNLLIEFSHNSITPVITHNELYPSCIPPTQPTSDAAELKHIQTS